MSAPTTLLFDEPGPRARTRHLIVTVAAVVVLLVLLGLVIKGLANPRNSQLTAAKWTPFLQGSTWADYLLPGLLSTLKAAGLSIVLSVVGGVLLGIGRLSTNRVLSAICGVFVEFFRSVPVLVMMLFAYYFALYVLHLADNQPFFGVVVGLVFYNSSVIAELIRSGVGSLPGGQREAGLAIGLSEGQAMWLILLPQAVTAMLPSLVSQLVVVLKDTALGYIIGYYDLVRGGQTFATNYGNLIPTMLVMAAMFIVINYTLSRVAQALERSLQRRGRVGGPPADQLIDNPAEAAKAGAS
ncbi:glutamate ABC transporter permease [Microlunatus endophyticus]|uniref:Glutamate ABC transporter permease n=1 Tax=Microlunatus endophyticus TaxID=1716077 RepID=A0A917W1C7_9ACTN|nr:amino acid ABC transporter permease [Microlunatus endophyticus]GGL50606.1 glutamate ABC transporter permease [Microlunatus endophyticus]